MFENNPIAKLFAIRYPILLAPMASVTTPQLAAAVAEAGGLGSLGCAGLRPDAVRDRIREFRALAGGRRKLHINFFVHDRPARNTGDEARVKALLQPFYDSMDAGEAPDPGERPYPYDDAVHAAAIEEKAEIVSFHFGLPSDAKLAEFKRNGSLVLSSATTVPEARELEARGVDAVIAQGWEAGGHRGTFLGDPEDGTIGTISLVPQIVDAVSVPVIAAGGIADGRGMVAAMALGASAVQLGTAFLMCPEANVPGLHRAALRACSSGDTRLTRAFTGRLARAIRNRYLDEQARRDGEMLPFPLMTALTGPLRTASLEAGVPDGMPLWSGQSAPMAAETGAAEVVAGLAADCRAQWSRLARACSGIETGG